MTAQGSALAGAAERFVGVPFKLRGRDPCVGLDCLGLVLASLAAIGRRGAAAPNYGWRNLDAGAFLPLAASFGLVDAREAAQPGDILLLQPGPAQQHLAIIAHCGGMIHAHAALRRVVLTPAPPLWPLLRRWRLATR